MKTSHSSTETKSELTNLESKWLYSHISEDREAIAICNAIWITLCNIY